MKNLVQISLASALFALASPSYSTEIGKVYSDLPKENCTWHSSTMLQAAREYGYEVATCDGRSEAWLTLAIPRADGKQDWQVIDHLRLGTLTGSVKFDDRFVCVLQGKIATEQWLPILDYSRKEPLTHQNGGLLQAWRVDTTTKRFELVPLGLLKRAKCVDESGGQ